MKKHILMCPPDYFGVEYTINPWMENQIGKVDRKLAKQQWRQLHLSLSKHANVELISPFKETPDMVFTANCGMVWGSIFIPSRFLHSQRKPEEAYFEKWFSDKGFDILDLPENISFEGAGDILPSHDSNHLWAGGGFRTNPETHVVLGRELNCRIISLNLVNPRFYHLDTCFCPLNDGVVLYYPPAFDTMSNHLIRQSTEKTIAVSDEDAHNLVCNAVLIGDQLFLNNASQALRQQLEEEGYTLHIIPVSEFIKAGGASKCLTFCW